MSSFNYYEGIREDAGNMIDEIGSSVTVNVPAMTVDTFGNHTTSSFTAYTETVWIRQLNEVMDVQGVGQLNREDIRFVCKYDTHIVQEAKITYNGKVYVVVLLDRPDESANVTHLVGLAKKELT